MTENEKSTAWLSKSLLDKIDKIRSLGLDSSFELPQIVVTGDQSSGKSTLLEKISGIPFPSAAGMCTRFATQVVMSHDESSKISAEFHHEDGRIRTLDEVESKDFNLIHGFIEEVSREVGKGSVTQSILTVKICGPNYPRLTVIDTPGYIQDVVDGLDQDLPQQIEEIVDKFISNERSINLAVIPANRDLVTNRIMKKLRDLDPNGTRTIGVITKIDLCTDEEIDQIVPLLEGNVRKFRYGYYAVAKEEDNEKNVDEENLRSLNRGALNYVDPDRKGVKNLRENLVWILSEHIKRELPSIFNELSCKISALREKIEKLGFPLSNNYEKQQFLTLNILNVIPTWEDSCYGNQGQHVMGVETPFRFQLKVIIDELYQKLGKLAKSPPDREVLKAEISKATGRSPGGFLPLAVFEANCYRNISFWKGEIYQFLEKSFALYLENCRNFLIDKLPANLADMVKTIIENLLRNWLIESKRDADDLIFDEVVPFTANNYFMDQVQKMQKLSKNPQESQRYLLDNSEDEIDNSEDEMQEFFKNNPHISNTEADLNTMCFLIVAYNRTVFKRICDSLVQNIFLRRFVRKGCPEIKRVLSTLDSSLIEDDPSTEKKRATFTKNLNELVAIEKILLS